MILSRAAGPDPSPPPAPAPPAPSRPAGLRAARSVPSRYLRTARSVPSRYLRTARLRRSRYPPHPPRLPGPSGLVRALPDQIGQPGRPHNLRRRIKLGQRPPAPGGDAVGGVHRLDAPDLAASLVDPREVQALMLAYQLPAVLHREAATLHLTEARHVAPPCLFRQLTGGGGPVGLARVQGAARGGPVAAVGRAVVVAHQQHTAIAIQENHPGCPAHREPARHGHSLSGASRPSPARVAGSGC